jgi:hypothetical protein
MQERENPIKVTDWVGKDAVEVVKEKYCALSMEGFSVYLFEQGVINSIHDYVRNKDGYYDQFSQIIAHIKDFIYNNNFKGASVNELNPNLIARQLGIKEASTVDVTNNVSILSIDPLADVESDNEPTQN